MQQMSLSRVRIVQWILVAVLATAPVFAYALGIGKLMLRSGLDEPLNGEIELMSVSPQELKTLKTSLASRADFENAGIDRPFFLTGIKYDVVQHKDGRSFLQLTTDEPIREPFLHLLLQVEWSGGRLIREYTALLDPPQWATAKPAEIQPPEVAENTPVPAPVAEPVLAQPETSTGQTAAVVPQTDSAMAAPTPAPAPTEAKAEEPSANVVPTATAAATPAPEATAQQPSPEVMPPAEHPAEAMVAAPPSDTSARGTASAGDTRAWASSWEYGPVKNGDTLGRIASKLRVDKTLTTQQIMIALLRSNPAAFYAKNVNNLKAGTILKVPEREEVESLSKTAAIAEFQAQYETWQKYKTQVAAASGVVTVPSEPETATAVEPQAKVAAPKATAKATAKVAAPAATAKPATTAKKATQAVQPAGEGDEDLLKIVRSNLENTTAPEGAKAPGVETRKDAAREQRALTEKVATLEEAIDSKELQNKEMRDRVGKMQEQVKNTSRLIELENKDMAQAQKQSADSAKAKAKPEPEPVMPAVTATPAPAPAVAQETPPAALPAPATARKSIRKPVVPPPAPVEETSFVQSLMDNLSDNPLLLTVLAGVGVLGAGIFGIHYMRRRRAAVEFEESILSGGSSIGPDNSSISESASQPGTNDTSFLSDFSQGGMGNIHTDEVDPIAEAEVYLAYGRDEQAEEILKEAVVKDPARHELKQKLLEIYHQRNDVAGFETLAEELYAALEGKGGKVWDKVEEMGRKISPNNPMFRGGAPSNRAAVAASGVAMAMDPHEFIDRDTTEHAASVRSQSLNFDMGDLHHDTPPAARGSTLSSSSDTGLDFDLGGFAAQETSSELEFDVGAQTPSAGASKGGLDMDFNLNDNVPVPARRAGSVDFDIPAEPLADNEISLDFAAPSGRGASADEGLTFAMDATAGDSPTLDFEASHETDVAVEESQWDETATKLDLAKAYIDMGDGEGARSILDEVLAEGNESQKDQARALGAQIH